MHINELVAGPLDSQFSTLHLNTLNQHITNRAKGPIMFFISFLCFCFFFLKFSSKALATIDSAEKAAIVAEHNRLRAIVKPPAAANTMKTMKWDDSLAKLAQDWSDGCVYENSDPEQNDKKLAMAPDGKPFGDRRIGENIAFSELISRSCLNDRK